MSPQYGAIFYEELYKEVVAEIGPKGFAVVSSSYVRK
jgi:hypothetical protein